MPPLIAALGQPSRPFSGELIDAPPRPFGARLPGALDEPRLLQTIEGWVQGTLLQAKGAATSLLQAFEYFEAVGLALFQGCQGHRLQVPPEGIATNRFHVFSLVCLNSDVKHETTDLFPKSVRKKM